MKDNSHDTSFDPEYDQIDLQPYIKGERKMMFGCSWEGCKEKIDITAEYISMEEQNNIRKSCEDYNPACDKLYIFSRYCPEHEKADQERKQQFAESNKQKVNDVS